MKHYCILFFIMLISLFSTAQETITMRNENGVYTVPCTVNGLKLRFIFDTGAADVSISATEALFMLKNEYLTEEDFIDKASYTLADGTIQENTIINLKEIKIGTKTLNNIRACVVNNISAPLLLGQSAIKVLGAWYIDGDKLFFGTKTEGINSSVENTPINKCVEEAKKFESYGEYDTAIALFQKACSVENYQHIYEFALFCDRNKTNIKKYQEIMPYEGICKAAVNNHQPMVEFLKSNPSIFKDNPKNGLRHYSMLIESGLWFLCYNAYQFCAYKLEDTNKALDFLIKGAEHNEKDCLYLLGYLYDPLCMKIGINEDIVKEDKQSAVQWYKKAIALGHTDAMFHCANLLLDGDDKTNQSVDLALTYLVRAGNLGHSDAMETLMNEYYFGYNSQRSVEKALYWANKLYKISESVHYLQASALIGIIYYEQKKYDEAFPYLKTASERIDWKNPPPSYIYLLLGESYYFGDGVNVDYKSAVQYYTTYIKEFEESNSGTESDAIYVYKKLGLMYENGLGVAQNNSNSFKFYRKAANFGDKNAEKMVAYAYLYGEGIERNIDNAIFWYNRAAQQNDASSWYTLGIIYSLESFGNYDMLKAVSCLEKAIECDKEHSDSYYELGRIYETGGEGISRSYMKAGSYYKKAAELGHEKAKEKIKEFE